MKTTKIHQAKKIAAATLASCLLAAGACASSIDFSIGLQFATNSSPPGLATNDVAGYLPQANWNGFANASGTNTYQILGDVAGTATAPSTPVYVGWSVAGVNNAAGTDGFPSGTPDFKLMLNYLNAANSAGWKVTITNLPPELTSGGYSVYVYGLNATAGKGGQYGISNAFTAASLATPLYLSAARLTDYKRSTATTWASADANRANFVVFSGLTDPNIVVWGATNSGGTSPFRSACQAIQLVPTYASTEPGQDTALVTNIPGPGQLGLSWITNAGTTGSLVVMNKGNSYGITRNPVDGVAYTANLNYGSGQDMGGGNYVVYSGPATNITVTGVNIAPNPGTYNVAVFAYSGSTGDGSVNYNLNNPPSSNSMPAPQSITGLSVVAPPVLRQNGSATAQALLNFDGGPAWDVTSLTNTGVMSSAPNVITVIPAQVDVALVASNALGSATITAKYTNIVVGLSTNVYIGTTNVQVIQVVSADSFTNSFTISIDFAAGFLSTPVLLGTDIAGYLPAASWNNILETNAVKNPGDLVADVSGTAFPTSVYLALQCNNDWSLTSLGWGPNGNYFQSGTPDYKLMSAYADSSVATTTTVMLTNLPPELTTGGYNLYVYALNDTAGRGGQYAVFDAFSGAELSAPLYLCIPSLPTDYQLQGVYSWGAAITNRGVALVFQGLTNANIVLSCTPTNTQTDLRRVVINGIQLVATHTATEPAPATALQVSQPAPGSLKLSWITNSGTDGSLVLMSYGSNSVTRNPVDGVTYTANVAYGSGQNLGITNYVVYAGAATNVTVTNLFYSGPWNVSVFAYTNSGTHINYTLRTPATSNLITIVPTFNIQPQPFTPQEGLAGASIQLVSGAVGQAPITYGWQKSTNGGSTWFNMTNSAGTTGANSNVLTFVSGSLANAGLYRMFATNGASMVLTSSVVSLTIDAAAIGVKFGGNSTPQSIVTDCYLPAAAFAGALMQSNWTTMEMLGGIVGTTNLTGTLTNNTGGTTAVRLHYAGNNTWYCPSGETTDNNGKLMKGYLKAYAAAGPTIMTLVFTNMPAGSYNVILYGVDEDGGGGPSVLAVTAGGNTYFWAQPLYFPGTFIPAPLSTDLGNPGFGHFLTLTNLTPDVNGAIMVSNSWVRNGTAYGFGGFGIPAVQLVNPSTNFPTATANIASPPKPEVLYAGRTVHFSVGAASAFQPLTYQWQKTTNDGASWFNVVNGGTTSGATNTTLTIANVGAVDAYGYRVIVRDAAAYYATSSVATLGIAAPPPANSYAAQVVALNPLAYYRLNELSPETNVYDFVGGFTGWYQISATNGLPGLTNPPYGGFETTNTAFQPSSDHSSAILIQSSSVGLPFGTLAGMSNVTFTMWIYPLVWPNGGSECGLLVDRTGSGGGGGIMYSGNGQNLAYQWNTNTAGTNIVTRGVVDSGLVLSADIWSFCAVVISPEGAYFYVFNNNALWTATDLTPLAPQTFGNGWFLGHDASSGDWANENCNAIIDEVAIFGSSLTPEQITSLYLAGKTGLSQNLSIAPAAGQKVVLTYDQGLLLEAPDLNGPWTTNSGATPPAYTNSASGAAQYYRLQFQP